MNQKERLEALADALIPEAIEWVKELRAYRVYQGNNPEFRTKAKIALGPIGAAVRLCATIENGRSNDLIESRVKALEAAETAIGSEQRQLVGSK